MFDPAIEQNKAGSLIIIGLHRADKVGMPERGMMGPELAANGDAACQAGRCKWISTAICCLFIGVSVVLDALHRGYKLHYSRQAGR